MEAGTAPHRHPTPRLEIHTALHRLEAGTDIMVRPQRTEVGDTDTAGMELPHLSLRGITAEEGVQEGLLRHMGKAGMAMAMEAGRGMEADIETPTCNRTLAYSIPPEWMQSMQALYP